MTQRSNSFDAQRRSNGGAVTFVPHRSLLCGRYDDASVFNTLAGDFDAIQDHFDFNGISASVVEDINGAGYGLHEIEINGQGANQSSFAGPNQDLVFDGQQIADFIDDWFV